MANYVLDYYPRYDRATPEPIKNMLKVLSEKHYPKHYNDKSGLIEFNDEEHDYLKEGIAEISDELLKKSPKISFFQKMNPKWSEGAELPCLGLIQFRLLLYNPYKMMMKMIKKYIRK